MSDLLIIKNITREGPGLLEGILENAGLKADIIDLHGGEKFPSPLSYKALVVLGGPDSANDKTLKMIEELAQVKAALDAGIPYLGICLGMQVLVKAAGGKVLPAPQKEVGFIDAEGAQNTVELTSEGKTDPLFTDLKDSLPVFHLHGETVELTDSVQLLGTGKHCRNQIIKVGKAYGIQSHFELTKIMLKLWAHQDPDLLPIGETELMKSYKEIEQEYSSVGQSLLTNFLKIAGLLR